jgi:hypothetical protein
VGGTTANTQLDVLDVDPDHNIVAAGGTFDSGIVATALSTNKDAVIVYIKGSDGTFKWQKGILARWDVTAIKFTTSYNRVIVQFDKYVPVSIAILDAINGGYLNGWKIDETAFALSFANSIATDSAGMVYMGYKNSEGKIRLVSFNYALTTTTQNLGIDISIDAAPALLTSVNYMEDSDFPAVLATG